jgi:general secretion pathway protein K
MIESEAGKVDLNAATFELLKSLFSIVGVTDDQSAALAAAVIDWRDQDDLVHLNGAESPQYRSANLPYGAKNEPFDSIEELRMVLGVTPDIFTKASSALTVYTHQRSVDPTVLAPLLRDALHNLPEWSQQGGRTATVGMVAPSTTSPLLGHSFTIRATAQTHKGNTFARNVVIRITGDRARPYQILAWRQDQ